MGIIIGVVIVVAVVIGAIAIGAIFKSSLKAGSKDASAASRLPAMTQEDSSQLSAARRSITSSRQLVLRIQDDELKKRSDDALTQAEGIVSAMKKQPAEIRRAKQFFGYYLPTINVVLGKYVELESNGMEADAQRSTALAFMEDTSKAFEVLYENMFKDEKLDLEVEAEAMQGALKRDGLL